ncbi:MAG: type II toxin-antitoxin system prevent-host-death family antitoxin [Candidatus Berkelbacteria bacterium]|nr:type II toxin-antitoxin system prevent-host-death family antitoxin [Candidatus Berkelbacteria bacterium]MCR4307186.1 type II toxin-antitoxin system prevent-host-death family antitoxin [Candidatus Berkelbacteria bacterium]
MNVINVHEAKTNFSKLLERAANGERIVIGKAGRPVARLEPISITARSRKVVGGGFRLQEKAGRPLTPEYLNELAESKYE